ncbi:MAG: MFS transporter [Clostridium sp.]|nr:MFS transporter [Clostridium sp.]
MIKIGKEHTGNKNIVIYLVFVFLSNFSFLSSFLSVFLWRKGASLSFVSVCFLIYQLSKFVFEIPTGFVSDKYSRKFSGVAGMLLLICSYGFLLSDDMALLLLAFFLKGLGITFLSGSLESLFVDSLDQKRLMKYNVVERLVFYSALALSAASGGLVIQFFGFFDTVVIDIVILGLTLAIVCQFETKPPVPGSGAVLEHMGVFSAARYAFSNQTVCLLLLMDFANAFSFVAVEDFYSAFLEDFGLSGAAIGLVIALQLIFSSLFGFFVPRISARFSRSGILSVLPVSGALLTILMYLPYAPLVLVPLVFLLQQILFAVYAPIKYQLFQKSIEPQVRATTLSLQSLMVSLGSVLFYGVCSMLGDLLALRVILILALTVTATMLSVVTTLLRKRQLIS